MSLATRCTSCGTVFRVVRDQLKISEGWVRCGRCQQVFNALEQLIELDSDSAPTPLPPSANAPTLTRSVELPDAAATVAPQPPVAFAATPAGLMSGAPQAAPSNAHAGTADDWRLDDEASAAADEHIVASPTLESAATEPPVEPSLPEPADAFDIVAEPAPPHAGAAASPAAYEALDGADHEGADRLTANSARESAAPALAAGHDGMLSTTPDFIRIADRQAAWHRPRVRAALGAIALLLALVLLLQMALRWRDALAARWPAATPALQALCGVAGCSIEPLRRVESLAVESSSLVKLDGNLYRFAVTLRNRDATAILLPAFDLTLTDAQGRVVARKMLRAGDLGASQAALPAAAELALHGVLDARAQPLAGYSVEIFYP